MLLAWRDENLWLSLLTAGGKNSRLEPLNEARHTTWLLFYRDKKGRFFLSEPIIKKHLIVRLPAFAIVFDGTTGHGGTR